MRARILTGKTFSRIIALFLISLLLTDKIMAGSRLETYLNQPSLSLFSNQALAMSSNFSGGRPSVSTRRSICQILFMVTGLMAVPIVSMAQSLQGPSQSTPLSSDLIRTLRQRSRDGARLGKAPADTPELQKIRQQPTAPEDMLRLFGDTWDLHLRELVLEQLSLIPRNRIQNLAVTDEQLTMLVQAQGEKSTSAWARHILDAMSGRYAKKIGSLNSNAKAQQKLFSEAEQGTEEQQKRLLEEAKNSQVLYDALTLIVSPKIKDTGRSLGSNRLLTVAREYPGTNASFRAFAALPSAVEAETPPPETFYQATLWHKPMTVSDPTTLKSLLAVIQGQSYLEGVNAAYYFFPDPNLRKEFLEVLLSELMLAAASVPADQSPLDNTHYLYLSNLLAAMSHQYQPELDDLWEHTNDPAVKEAAQQYRYILRLESHPSRAQNHTPSSAERTEKSSA